MADVKPPSSSPSPDVEDPNSRFTYRFAGVFVRRAKTIQCCVLLSAVFTVALLVAFGLGGFTESDSFYIRDDFRTEEYHALTEARDIVLAEFAAARDLPRQGVKAQLHDLFLLVRAKNGVNLATPEVMASIHALDAEFVGNSNYKDVCLVENGTCVAPTTLVRLDEDGVASFDGPQVDVPTTQAALDSVVNTYVTSDDATIRTHRAFLFDSSVSSPDLHVEYYRSYYPMGRPIEGYKTAADDPVDQLKDFTDKIRFFFDRVNVDGVDTAEYEVVLFGVASFDIVFSEQVEQDTLWGLGAMIFVFAFMWFHTRSLFLATMALIQIVLAFPFAMLIYHGVFSIVLFDSLHSLAIFILLGVAADDVFVFTDAFNQNKSVQSDDLTLLMESTYVRAAKSMFVTSFTTMAAFLATAISEILPIASFGLWAASLVFVNYILILIWYPPALIIWERTIRKREQCCCCLRSKGKGKGKGNGNDGDANTAQAAPAADGTPEADVEEKASSSAAAGTMSRKDLLASNGKSTRRIKVSESAIPGKDHRFVERLFYFKFYPCLHKLRYGILVAFLGLFIAGLVLTSRLEPLDEEEKFLPSDHFLERAQEWMDEFQATDADSNHVVDVTWGIVGIDRSGTNKFDPDDLGTVVWDESFKLYDPAAQAAIATACDRIENRTDLAIGLRSCFIRDFSDFCGSTGRAFPFVAAGPVPAGRTADEHQQIEFAQVVNEWSYTEDGENALSDVDVGIERVTVAGEEILNVKLAMLKTTSNLEPGQPRSETLPVFNAWQQFMRELNADAPETANKGLQISQAWLWMVVEDGLVTSAVNGVAISGAVSFVVLLLATMNGYVALSAIFCIAGIVLSSLGAIQAQGGQLGITETISSVIILGFSFDFVVHFGVSYVESSLKTRQEKTREAATAIGISVLAGGLTTLGASFFLLGGVILFFKKMGIMMATVIVFSLLWANLCFLAMMDTFGPVDGHGDLAPYAKAASAWFKAKCPCCRGCAKSKKPVATGAQAGARPNTAASTGGVELQEVEQPKQTADDTPVSAL